MPSILVIKEIHVNSQILHSQILLYHGADKKVVIGDLSPTISKLPSKIPAHNDPDHHIHQFHEDGKLFLIELTIFCR